jgi:hypothetical protein
MTSTTWIAPLATSLVLKPSQRTKRTIAIINTIVLLMALNESFPFRRPRGTLFPWPLLVPFRGLPGLAGLDVISTGSSLPRHAALLSEIEVRSAVAE